MRQANGILKQYEFVNKFGFGILDWGYRLNPYSLFLHLTED